MVLTDSHHLATGHGKRKAEIPGGRTWFFASVFSILLLAEFVPAVVTLKVGGSGGAVPFPHSNGRQIGRNHDERPLPVH